MSPKKPVSEHVIPPNESVDSNSLLIEKTTRCCKLWPLPVSTIPGHFIHRAQPLCLPFFGALCPFHQLAFALVFFAWNACPPAPQMIGTFSFFWSQLKHLIQRELPWQPYLRWPPQIAFYLITWLFPSWHLLQSTIILIVSSFIICLPN